MVGRTPAACALTFYRSAVHAWDATAAVYFWTEYQRRRATRERWPKSARGAW